jgi:very-short-patch-repair endonuclease
MLSAAFDKIYTTPDVVVRNMMVLTIKNSNASVANKKYWEEAPADMKERKIKHMQQICKLADHSNEVYLYHEPWNKGKTKLTDARLMKNSQDRTGSGNPMHGSVMSDEQRLEKSNLIKSRIASGEWTPHVHNSRTHLDCSFNGKKYRSSWEVMYAALNQQDLYESVRIKYDYLNNNHTYIVDFVNHTTKILTEIKPKEHTTDPKVLCKEQAGIKWCLLNGYQYRILTQQYFVDEFDNIPFEKITIPNIRVRLAKIKYEATKTNRNSKAGDYLQSPH